MISLKKFPVVGILLFCFITALWFGIVECSKIRHALESITGLEKINDEDIHTHPTYRGYDTGEPIFNRVGTSRDAGVRYDPNR